MSTDTFARYISPRQLNMESQAYIAKVDFNIKLLHFHFFQIEQGMPDHHF